MKYCTFCLELFLTRASSHSHPQVGRFFYTLTKNNFMGLIKLASVDISKRRLNNNAVIAPSLLVSPGLDRGWTEVISSASLPRGGLPISPWACLHLISPSHFTERKFLEGWARQIATDLSLPSGAVSFLSSG